MGIQLYRLVIIVGVIFIFRVIVPRARSLIIIVLIVILWITWHVKVSVTLNKKN